MKAKFRIRWQKAGIWFGMGVLTALFLLPFWGTPRAEGAESMYSYIDDKGIMVVTDDLEKVPERFRRQIKIRDGEEPSSTSVGALKDSAVATVREKVQGLTKFLSDSILPDTIIPGFTNHQSVLLIGGFLGAVVSFATMSLSRSPSIKFAMKWVLMFVVGGMIYGLYFSEMKTFDSTESAGPGSSTGRPESVLQRMKGKAKEIEDIQQERAGRIDRFGR